MKYIMTQAISLMLCMAVFLSGCVTTSGPVKQSGPVVGPAYSSQLLAQSPPGTDSPVAEFQGPRLDIIVPVFDPGLPQDLNEAVEEGIWPELRRAEANLFAWKLKVALEETGKFGAVRVAPDKSPTGDLYVLGTIKKSTGEEIGIAIEVFDSSEKKWLKNSYHHDVAANFYNNPRNTGTDPYAPVFTKAANDIVEAMRDYQDKDLENLKRLTEIRFGASFSEEAFLPYLKKKDQSAFSFLDRTGNFSLVGLPSDNDPMLQRIRSLRVRDQLFIDRMQNHYERFSQNMRESYAIWQEGSHAELMAARQARRKAIGQAVVGALLLAGAAYASNKNKNNNAAVTTAAVAAGLGGVFMLSKSIKTSKEAGFHRDALAELGQSLNLELESQVVAFEETTTRLTGDAHEQFNQWRAFLKKIFQAESVPEVQL